MHPNPPLSFLPLLICPPPYSKEPLIAEARIWQRESPSPLTRICISTSPPKSPPSHFCWILSPQQPPELDHMLKREASRRSELGISLLAVASQEPLRRGLLDSEAPPPLPGAWVSPRGGPAVAQEARSASALPPQEPLRRSCRGVGPNAWNEGPRNPKGLTVMVP
ncbi:hypothetical protein NL676_024763 [Syzygium grande]|nr:hypothetical protein NL676_024763 [Syzygium grande]